MTTHRPSRKCNSRKALASKRGLQNVMALYLDVRDCRARSTLGYTHPIRRRIYPTGIVVASSRWMVGPDDMVPDFYLRGPDPYRSPGTE